MAALVPVARRAGANLARTARRLVAGAALPRRTGLWPVLRITSDLGEVAGPRLPWSASDGPSLLDVLRTLACAADDPQVDGVLLRLDGAPSGWSRLQSLRRGLERVREGGKPVVVYADSLDVSGLLLASAADRVWIPESGRVSLVGLRLESFHLKGLLEHVGLRAEVLRVGGYKSAGERFTRETMSPEEREQMEALADDWYGALVDAIASGRDLSPDGVRDRIDRGPYTARAAVEAGLIDACLYPDEIEQALETLAPAPPPERPGPRRIHQVDGNVYHVLRAADPGWRPLFRGLPRLAYVVARGFIHRGGGRGIASDPLRELLGRLREQDDVRGVVLRLDTPGGEPLASDLLWRDITRLGREKPVVVSMGDVVASGGYYMAAGADAILAEAGTVTGSIGVVGGKLNAAELYEKIGVGRDAVERGARAGLHSETRGFTPDERKALREEFTSAYGQFVERVAAGRALSAEAVERVAGGRVWSGARALHLGLVDSLGGPLEALGEVRRRAGLHPEERVLLDVQPRVRVLDWPLRLLPGRGMRS